VLLLARLAALTKLLLLLVATYVSYPIAEGMLDLFDVGAAVVISFT
jgi:hypothetical protein